MSERIEILKRLSFFEGLNESELLGLSSICDEVPFKKGDIIIEEGKPAEALYIIKRGCVEIKKPGLNLILGEGSPIGEISFIDKGLPSATATAQEDSVFIKIPSDAFEGLLRENMEFAYKVYRSMAETLCQKLRDTNEWLATKEWLAKIEKETDSQNQI